MNETAVSILAVDDSQDILFALSAICELEGWTTRTTTEGSHAIEMIREQCPDIVLVDYHMPRMDGIEVVKHIRAIAPSVPIIVLTIESSREIAKQFMAAGADDFALKPIKPLDLISRIRVHLRGAGRRSSEAPCAAQEPQTVTMPAEEYEYVKGISPPTLTIVCDYLKSKDSYLSINEISCGCGLAYQTTYRYLIYLVGENLVTVHSEYGRQGRPKQKYRWKPQV